MRKLLVLILSFFIAGMSLYPRSNFSLADELPLHDTSRIEKLIVLAQMNIPGNLDSVKIYLDSARKYSMQIAYQGGLMKSLNILGVYYWYSGMLPMASDYFRQSLVVAEKIRDTSYITKTLSNLGLVYSYIGSADSSEHYLLRAIDFAEKSSDEDNMVKAMSDLSSVYTTQNRYGDAINLLREASAYYEKLNDALDLAIINIKMANLYMGLNKFNESRECLQKAYNYNKMQDKRDLLPAIYNNLGNLFLQVAANTDSSKYYFLEVIKVADPGINAGSIVSANINLGNVYYSEEEYSNALKHYLKAIKSDGIENLYQEYSAILINVGMVYTAMNKLDSAEYYTNKGLQIAIKNSLLEYQKNAYLNLFRVDSLNNNLASAIDNFRNYKSINDSIWNKELKDKVAELEVQHEIEKKEQANEILKRDNLIKKETINRQRILSALISLVLLLALILLFVIYRSRSKLKSLNIMLDQQNKELTELDQTKDKFFSIIAHDLKSPFTALLGLITELDEQYDNYNTESKKEIIHSLKKSSHNTFNLLINLLDWARAQQGKIVNKPDNISLRPIVDKVFEILLTRASLKSHTLANNVPEDIKAYADANLLEAILINLINNAIKFTQREGRIAVSAIRDNGVIQVGVEDNGIGIPNTEIPGLFDLNSEYRMNGTENESGTGLGLLMCREYVSLMGGMIWVKSQPGKGSMFCFTVPEES